MARWPYNGPWKRIRLAILERDSHRCYACQHPASDVDHIIPVNEGGAPYDPDNLRASCHQHNRGRTRARSAAIAKLDRTPSPEPSRKW